MPSATSLPHLSLYPRRLRHPPFISRLRPIRAGCRSISRLAPAFLLIRGIRGSNLPGRRQFALAVSRLRDIIRSVQTRFSLWLALLLTACDALAADTAPDQHPTPTAPPQILVGYYSLTGNTEQMAQAVVEGAKGVSGVAVRLKKIEQISKADLERADAIVLGCPTYFGNIPGQMKVILDDWSWKLKVDFTDKIGGAFSTGGGQTGGKEFVVLSLAMFMLSNRMIVAGPLYRNERTGSIWGEPGASAITGPLDPGVGAGELDSAKRLGERIATLAKKLAAKT